MPTKKPKQESHSEEIKRWINMSKGDLKKASDNFKMGHYDLASFLGHYDLASFLCQQSVEKGFKALILQKENKIIKTHDILFLAERVNLPLNLRDVCKELTLMYIYTRYPDTSEVKDIKNKSERYLTFTGTVLAWIEEQLLKKT